MNIYGAILDTNSKILGTIMVVDIANSTAYKESVNESTWLVNYAKAFDYILDSLREEGEVVKYLGDGMMIFFKDDNSSALKNSPTY